MQPPPVRRAHPSLSKVPQGVEQVLPTGSRASHGVMKEPCMRSRNHLQQTKEQEFLRPAPHTWSSPAVALKREPRTLALPEAWVQPDHFPG